MNGISCFVIFYVRCSKLQFIDFFEVGYFEEWLDCVFIVLFLDWYRIFSFDYDIYFLNVELLDVNDNLMVIYFIGDLAIIVNW